MFFCLNRQKGVWVLHCFLRDPAAVGYIDRECLYGLIAYAFDISFTYVQISLRYFGLFVVSSFDLSATVDDQSLEY